MVAVLQKLEVTVTQNLSIIAAELQELHKFSLQNQTIINHLDAKVVELSQHAIFPDELHSLQHGVESDVSIITNDQTCAIINPISAPLDNMFSILNELSKKSASTPIPGDAHDKASARLQLCGPGKPRYFAPCATTLDIPI